MRYSPQLMGAASLCILSAMACRPGDLDGVEVPWVRGRGRAFNPAGSDGGPEADWNYDVVYRWRYPRLAVAIIDA